MLKSLESFTSTVRLIYARLFVQWQPHLIQQSLSMTLLYDQYNLALYEAPQMYRVGEHQCCTERPYTFNIECSRHQDIEGI